MASDYLVTSLNNHLKVTGKVTNYSKYQNQQILNAHLRRDKIGTGSNARGN